MEVKEQNAEVNHWKNVAEFLTNIRKANQSSIRKLKQALQKQKEDTEIFEFKYFQERKTVQQLKKENRNWNSDHFDIAEDSKL